MPEYYLSFHPISIIFYHHNLKGQPIMPNDDIMTVKELADYLKIAEKTAYRFASEGKVPGFKVGSAWRFKKEEIDAWIKRQSEASTAQNQKED
jgi:excisionase family DNA binding protein